MLLLQYKKNPQNNVVLQKVCIYKRNKSMYKSTVYSYTQTQTSTTNNDSVSMLVSNLQLFSHWTFSRDRKHSLCLKRSLSVRFSLHWILQVFCRLWRRCRSVVCEPVAVGSARPAAPRRRTLWLRCRAALCSTCSALVSSRPPASGAASSAVAPAASSAASAPACRASWPTAPSSPSGWFYMESWRKKLQKWGEYIESQTCQCTLVLFS